MKKNILAAIMLVVFSGAAKAQLLDSFSSNIVDLTVPFVDVDDEDAGFRSHLPAFYIGPNFLAEKGSVNAFSGIPQMEGKGMELGFTLCDKGIAFNEANTVGLSLGLQITRNRFQFNRNNYWTTTPAGGPCLAVSSQDIEKGIMRYWSLRCPVSLEIQSFAQKDIFVSVGAELEYRFGGVSKYKDADGKKHKETNDLNLETLGANALVQVGYGDFSVIARYALTPLVKDLGYNSVANVPTAQAELYPISISLGFGF